MLVQLIFAVVACAQIVPRDLPTLSLPSVAETSGATEISGSAETSPTYSYAITIDDDTDNPYILRASLPENLVFIILAAIIGLLFVIVTMFYLITWVKSLHRAKHQSEKYYYNQPLMMESSTSSNSSMWEKKSEHSNLSQLTLNQPLNNKNRGSMFFSPTDNFLEPYKSNTGLDRSNSRLSLMELNGSALDLGSFSGGSGDSSKSELRLKRPPSQYLEDLLGNSDDDSD